MRSIAEFNKVTRPERVIQFGEGGFLRGFADWMLHKMNKAGLFDGSVVVVQPIEKGLCDLLTSQNCLYTHLVRSEEGVEAEIIDIISRCVKPYEDFEEYLALADIPTMRYIISNTTEAGIVYSDTDTPEDTKSLTFPAKLTLLMYRRYKKGLGGFIILPCELIDRNGDKLKECVLRYCKKWALGEDFEGWVEKENVFTNTLVDRINTGYPKGESLDLGYEDQMVNTSELFHLWVIECDYDIESELPFTKAGLNVIVTPNLLETYRTRKVRILNGAHTSLVPHALLSGFETVKDCVDNAEMREHIRKCVFDEIIPTLDLPEEELVEYASDVLRRFANPYIKHFLASIALNSVSKFKVRVLPSILEYIKRYGKTPVTLVFALKRLIEFYKVGTPNDSPEVVEYIRSHEIGDILANEALWGTNLSFLLDEVK